MTATKRPGRPPHSFALKMNIKRMTDEGHSASYIAAQVGLTRNAVIGVWHRDGMTLNRPRRPVSAKTRQRKARVRTVKPKRGHQHKIGPWRRLPGIEKLPHDNEAMLAASSDDIAVCGVSLLDLSARACHWPLSYRADDGLTAYCGNAVSAGEYCSAHHRLRLA